jgi:plastocyanin
VAVLVGTPLAYQAVDAQKPAGPTGAVAGHVRLVAKPTRRLPSAGAYPARTVTVAAAHDTSELANVVVFVKAPVTPAPPMRVSIRQKDEEFFPHLVAVTAGSTVDFPNDDLIFHNVFSLSRAGTFDLGRYPRGQSKGRTFREPGFVKVFCNLHSHMSAVVRVFDHPFFAIPDEEGAFTIAGLPAGRHDVSAWHERVGEVTLATVVSAGRTASLSFSLPLQDLK